METKGALRSKTVIGAVLTLAGTFTPIVANGLGYNLGGLEFDPDTGRVSFDLYSVGGAIATAAIPGGGALAWIGRRAAKKVIRGLW